jgi:hypothetical protein
MAKTGPKKPEKKYYPLKKQLFLSDFKGKMNFILSRENGPAQNWHER